MLIDPTIWPKLHGASTHFPMALAMAAALFDGLGFAWPKSSPRRAQLLAAGYFTIILGALGTIPAVLSGLFMTGGEVLGHDALLFHHLFVWPAFAGIVGLGFWRAIKSERATPRGFAVYLVFLFSTSGLMGGAGYWGGEMMLNGASPDGSTAMDIPMSPELAAQGRNFYTVSCSECHGDDAHGDEGPDLHNISISNSRIASTVKTGIKGEMPTFAKKYNDQQIAALVNYVRSLK